MLASDSRLDALEARPAAEAALAWLPRLKRHHARTLLVYGHRSIVGLLLVLFLLVATERVYPSSVQISVSAVVLKKVWARVAGSPGELRLTEADIARGYVDVAYPTVLTVRNNSDDGFLVACDADPTLVSRLAVGGLPRGLTELGPTGGFLVQPGYFRHETTFELHWRIYLAQEAKAGPHLWPVVLHVQAN